MRVRKIVDAETKVSNHPLLINDCQNYQGRYQNLFNNNNPIHLEIGMGKGGFIYQSALEKPDVNFIGLEKEASVLCRALVKMPDDLKNLRFMLKDAQEIQNVFADEIAVIYLNFSDPWPKRRHQQRRLTNLFFLKQYQLILKKDGLIIFKTDNKDLFEYSLEQFKLAGFKIIEKSVDLHRQKENLIMSEYEKKFHEQKMSIYYLKVVK